MFTQSRAVRSFSYWILSLMSSFFLFTASADSRCYLNGVPSCTDGTENLTGKVEISASIGYDIRIDGSYVDRSSTVWDTSKASVGTHYLQQCANQTNNIKECIQVWVPNLVWVSHYVWVPQLVWVHDYVWVSNWVWVTDYECVAYDEDGNCLEYDDYGYYVDEGYYEDNGYWEDDGAWVDQGGYEDHGSYQDQCTITPVTTYVCSEPLTVTVARPAPPISVNIKIRALDKSTVLVTFVAPQANRTYTLISKQTVTQSSGTVLGSVNSVRVGDSLSFTVKVPAGSQAGFFQVVTQ